MIWYSYNADALITTGQPSQEYPTKRFGRLSHHRHTHFSNQPRIISSLKRNQLAHDLGVAVILHPDHLMRTFETTSGWNLTISTLVTRPIWNGNQHHQHMLPAASIRVCVLPARNRSGSEHDELGLGDVLGNRYTGYGLLCCLGKKAIYAAGHDCAERGPMTTM